MHEQRVNSIGTRQARALATRIVAVSDAYHQRVQTSTALLVGGAVGALLGALTVLFWRLSERDHGHTPNAPEPVVPPGVAAVLSVLRSSALVVGSDDQVLKASAPAHMLGIVRGRDSTCPIWSRWSTRYDATGRSARASSCCVAPGERPTRNVAARVAPLGSRLVLVLVEDRTRERRVEAIRRDFVANVSHELKTPVGALNLLAEAVAEAADDPEAVHAVLRADADRERAADPPRAADHRAVASAG